MSTYQELLRTFRDLPLSNYVHLDTVANVRLVGHLAGLASWT